MTRLLLRYLFPIGEWLENYSVPDFRQDLIAGCVVLFITVPQVIAYAFLAGVPAQAGLYAAVAALFCYAFLGSSRTLSVGPTAIVAMLTLESASSVMAPGSEGYFQVTVALALLTGAVLLVLRLINFGAITTFLSHAVITGFISAAAVLIIANQLPSAMGLAPGEDTSLFGVADSLFSGAADTNVTALAIALGAIFLLIFFRHYVGNLLTRAGLSAQLTDIFVKAAPMLVVVIGVAVTSFGGLDQTANVAVVGHIPTTLPGLSYIAVSFDDIRQLLPSAVLIAMVVFLESTSIGAAMASKRRQRINPNQELVGLGVANIGSSLVGGFPVAGSFARTVLNYGSGAVTPVASLITAVLVLVTLWGLASWFYYLPRGVLAAIIVVSAWQLIDIPEIRKIFAFNSTDASTYSATFVAVLMFGVEGGILSGIAISFLLLVRNSSRPHIAVIGRVGQGFRNAARYDARTSPSLLAFRVDESFYFVNTRYIENFLTREIERSPGISHVLLICSATNFVDASGLEMLEDLNDRLIARGIRLNLTEVKGPVMDKLKLTDFYNRLSGKIFFTTGEAFAELAGI